MCALILTLLFFGGISLGLIILGISVGGTIGLVLIDLGLLGGYITGEIYNKPMMND